MGDFLLDFRPPAERRMAGAASFLKFFDDMQVTVVEKNGFSLLLTSSDEPRLWAPFQSAEGNYLVALCGRVALDERDWDEALASPGDGGVVCKAIANRYRAGGIKNLECLNGNYVAFIYDSVASKVHIVTDRCGMLLAYEGLSSEKPLVFGSHPDALAFALGEDQNLDVTSLAEFLTTGRLTFPFTYYRNIRGMAPGCIHTITLQHGAAEYDSKRRYFAFDFKTDRGGSDGELPEQLAMAFRNAVRRRTAPRLGKTAIGLSGGLDSRVILSATMERSHIQAFTLFDEENVEFKTAKSLADACNVTLVPIRRDFDYYGNSAELGVKISGGTGCIASNHFLGIREHLVRSGVQNLLTGCYCDYLLKGLALNTAEQKITRSDQLADFKFEFYRPCFWSKTAYRNQVEARLRNLFPECSKGRLSPEDWLKVECKRTFPLAYEGDLAQRVIPQRVMPWFLPIADNEIIDVYLRIPSRDKLNASLFKKMVSILCDERVLRVPDSNTGAPVNASEARYSFHRYFSALSNRIHDKVFPGLATRGSWPNWTFYLRHSGVIQSLWRRKNGIAQDVFGDILGVDLFKKPVSEYHGREVEFFLRLLTQKLWLDQRAAIQQEAPSFN